MHSACNKLVAPVACCVTHRREADQFALLRELGGCCYNIHLLNVKLLHGPRSFVVQAGDNSCKGEASSA